MKYRFTAEGFFDEYTRAGLPRGISQLAAARANAKLEQWEKESQTVYGTGCCHGQLVPKEWGRIIPGGSTHEAILWNPRKIGEKK